jgi:SAM-dependent methyltransferase
MPGRPVERVPQPGWSQSLELPDGSVVEGITTLDQQWRQVARFPIPDDLRGKRVLDIGAADGWFSFEMERRGAHVIALEPSTSTRILEAKKLLRSRIDVRFGDISTLGWSELGTFDIILAFGVLDHIASPAAALENICGMARSIVCIDTAVPILPELQDAGFARIRTESTLADRAYLTAHRAWDQATIPPAPAPPPALVCFENSRTRDQIFSVAAQDTVNFYFKWEGEELSVVNVFPEVSGFGIPPLKVIPSDGGWQGTFRLPPGLRPGWHDFCLRVAGSSPCRPIRIGVDVPDEARRYWPAEASNHLRIGSVTDGKSFERDRIRVGEDSAVSLWVQGLPSTADPADIRIRLNGTDLPATWLEAAGTGARQVNATLPPGVAAGEARISVVHGNRESVASPVQLHT